MIGFKRLIFSAIAVVSLTACVKSEIDISVKTGDVISFRPLAINTKAQSLTNDALNPFKTMGIYAAATGSDNYDSVTHTANYLQNIKVERADAASPWTTVQNYYWPVGKTTFFGYAPYNAAGSTITNTAFGAPKIDFTVNSDQAKQIDLLIASTVENATKTTNAVTIPMKHALTKIGFSAKLSHNPSEAQHINWLRVTKVEIFGVYSRGKHTMKAEAAWTDLKDIKAEASPFEVNDDINNLGGLRSINLDTTYQKLTLDDGYLFMLPQPFTESAKLRVYVVADWTEGNKDISFDDPIEFDLAQTNINWDQGKAINYNINIDITDHVQTGSTITAELVPWSNAEIDSDITSRQLNLTRIEADVFDAAITRVYFWSNQPLNKVYISPVCYEGTLPSAGGAAKGIQEIFNNLTATNPWEATNLHYNADTGQGYFELDRVNSNSTPQSYLLYVYAGGLRRSVQVNIKNTDYPQPIGTATSPFVGTFHRFDEYGERIITWNNTGPWIAVIEPLNSYRTPDGNGGYADYEDVIFDRYVSPAQEVGILHTNNPGNAEDYLVSDTWDKLVSINGINTRALIGNGKVYLRVGWKKNRIRAAGSINRYAKITVRDQINDMNTSKVLGVLFIRKGELDDYLMRPEDPILGSYAGNTRKDALKFSPYDVTSPYGTGLKSDYYEYPIIPTSGGKFVDYPTQSGAYFKWGSGRGVSIFTEYLPKFNFSEPLPLTWADAIDVCPEGYRVPMYDKTKPSVDYVLPQNSSLDNLEYVQSVYVTPAQENSSPFRWLKNTPYPTDDSANWIWGYYADGYFDRGKIIDIISDKWAPNSKVRYDDNEGYDGFMLFNPTSLSSLFLPAVGQISGSSGQMFLSGVFSGIPLATASTINSNSYFLSYVQRFQETEIKYLNVTAAAYGSGAAGGKTDGMSYRCVKGEKQDLTKDGKYVLYFDNDQYSAPKPITGAPNSSTIIPSFAGPKYWSTQKDGNGTNYYRGNSFTFNDKFTVLYAIW